MTGVLATLGAVGLAGCGTTALSSRGTNPVIQDFNFRWWSDASTLATTASRRLALMAYKKDADGKEHLLTCAEPPPDVGETFAKALAAQLELSAPASSGGGNLNAGLSQQVATAIAPLMARSQGLQLLRDSSYTLCIDYMNGWVPDSATYLQIKQQRFDVAVRLIEKELPMLAARAQPLGAPPLPPAASAPLRSTSAATP